MSQFVEFATNHLMLFVALAVVLLLIFINEKITQKQRAKQISPQQLVGLMNDEQAVVLDLREADAFNKGHIIHATRVAATKIDEDYLKKFQGKKIVLVCSNGTQSASLASKLQKDKANIMALAGGVAAWQQANLPLEKGK